MGTFDDGLNNNGFSKQSLAYRDEAVNIYEKILKEESAKKNPDMYKLVRLMKNGVEFRQRMLKDYFNKASDEEKPGFKSAIKRLSIAMFGIVNLSNPSETKSPEDKWEDLINSNEVLRKIFN